MLTIRIHQYPKKSRTIKTLKGVIRVEYRNCWNSMG